MTAKELKELLANVPDEAEVLMHLESKGGRAFEVYAGKYFKVDKAVLEDDEEETGLPYDGNCLVDTMATSNTGVVVLSDWRL